MKKKLYREKSLENISSPEQMDEYIKVTSPKIWIFMAALAAIIGAFFLLSRSYDFETATTTTTLVRSGTGFIFLGSSKTDDGRALNTDSKVILNGKRYSVDNVVLVTKDDIYSEYPFAREFYENFVKKDSQKNTDTAEEEQSDDFYFLITYIVGEKTGDGLYEAKLVLEQANAFDFLFGDKKE